VSRPRCLSPIGLRRFQEGNVEGEKKEGRGAVPRIRNSLVPFLLITTDKCQEEKRSERKGEGGEGGGENRA